MQKLYTYCTCIDDESHPQTKSSNDSCVYRLELNSKHEIFQGHFPGNPILPGVCQVQIVKEIFESVHPEYNCIISSKAIKFLSIIDPTKDHSLKLKWKLKQGDDLRVQASIYNENRVFMKLDMMIATTYNG